MPVRRIATVVGRSVATVSRFIASLGPSSLSALEPAKPVLRYEREAPGGVVVLFVQIGALCSENPLHDKHLRFRHFRALHPFRADWCALAPVAV